MTTLDDGPTEQLELALPVAIEPVMAVDGVLVSAE
jgi:hypothetical protein